MSDRQADVVVQISGDDVLAGRLYHRQDRGSGSETFIYTPDYLADTRAYALDPRLPLVAGPLHTANGRAMFAAFSDCAPDRWGQRLLLRNEKHLAAAAGRQRRTLREIDYLLGISDDLRQGSLRFRDPESGTYLADGTDVPPLARLPELLAAAAEVESDRETRSELALLLRPGSTLGGARPKVHIQDTDGRVAIAKFPSPRNDTWNVIGWEAVALHLARQAGIDVPNWRLEAVGSSSVLLVDRFDRSDTTRVGYVSAMTMLDLTDGQQSTYTEIADAIRADGDRPRQDQHQLWRRMAFGVLIANTDDHLRNHGFLRRTTAGWSLSPAFDLNPDPESTELSTGVDDGVYDLDIETAWAVAPLFDLSHDDAADILRDVVGAVAGWHDVARGYGLADEIELMAAAFDGQRLDRARTLAGA